MRNLATFVTTSMGPEAQGITAQNLHRNFIDHAEYPISAEIEQRCIRMLADLFHAPGETTGCRTQGSSEAIMLGALSLKWKWKEARLASRRGGTTNFWPIGWISTGGGVCQACGRAGHVFEVSSSVEAVFVG
jgi:glutamate/tyrosine decarboxylase-like PLP-dependent enzyme